MGAAVWVIIVSGALLLFVVGGVTGYGLALRRHNRCLLEVMERC